MDPIHHNNRKTKVESQTCFWRFSPSKTGNKPVSGKNYLVFILVSIGSWYCTFIHLHFLDDMLCYKNFKGSINLYNIMIIAVFIIMHILNVKSHPNVCEGSLSIDVYFAYIMTLLLHLSSVLNLWPASSTHGKGSSTNGISRCFYTWP